MVNISQRNSAPDTSGRRYDGAESELKACIHEQSVVFENAVIVIERLEKAAKDRQLGTPDSISQLQKSLDQVVTAQQKVSAAHERFTKTKAILSVDLRAMLGRHEELLRTLIGRIDHLQQIFEGIRSELTPQLDVESRRRNMQAAYLKSLKTL